MSRVKPLLVAASLAVFVFSAACSGGGNKENEQTPPADSTTGTSSVGEPTGVATGLVPQSLGTSGAGALGTVLATVAVELATTTSAAAVTPTTASTGAANTPGTASTQPAATARPTSAPGSTPVGSVGNATVTAVIASRSGNNIELVIAASGEGGQKLGGWAIDVEFDPARMSVDTCTVNDTSVCNPKYNDRTVRIVGTQLNGNTGEIARVKLTMNGSGPTNIQVKPFQCVTPEAAPLTCNAVTFAIPAQ